MTIKKRTAVSRSTIIRVNEAMKQGVKFDPKKSGRSFSPSQEQVITALNNAASSALKRSGQ